MNVNIIVGKVIEQLFANDYTKRLHAFRFWLLLEELEIRQKSSKSLRLSTILSHHVHMFRVEKADGRRRWLRICKLEISARLRAWKFSILNFEFYIFNFNLWILNFDF